MKLCEKQLIALQKEMKNAPTPSVSLLRKESATPLQILISTLISLRTKDQITLEASRRLFAVAPDQKAIAGLSELKIAELIFPAGFYQVKAERIRKIAHILFDLPSGEVPQTRGELIKLPGVGPKTAALVLSEALDIPAICVDIHVHRIANRLGWINSKEPEKSEPLLEELFDKSYWNNINSTLVAFGQTICRPMSPFCSRCILINECPRRDVLRFR